MSEEFYQSEYMKTCKKVDQLESQLTAEREKVKQLEVLVRYAYAEARSNVEYDQVLGQIFPRFGSSETKKQLDQILGDK